ncbi:allergen Tha p 1-like [Ostrinia nubilalis]|uniref:allergen Tha p 1-like n=1 Tax=Ostrinia furnacalis TaxID=93504 RepID=UPI00103B323A|nr:allergen Tha p 1-like [Ostrinia furnacalis]
MKTLLFAIALTALACCARAQVYTDRYDTVNLDDVLANKRLTVAYIKCMLDKGGCTSEGRELKSHIAEALQNGCAKCTKAQREGMRRVIKHLIQHEKGYWQELVEKYDPKRVYTQKYENELNSL